MGSPYLQGIYGLGIGTKEDEGIKEKPNSGGRPPKLDQENVEDLRTELRKKDYWTTQEVKIKLLEKFGVELSEDQVRRIILRGKLNKLFSEPYPIDSKTY